MLAPLATSACSIRSTIASLLTTEYFLNGLPNSATFEAYATARFRVATGYTFIVIPRDDWEGHTSNRPHINPDRPTRSDASLPGLRAPRTIALGGLRRHVRRC